MKISLCMIVRDEEEVLERCLRSAKDFADEIVIVDTGSKDRSKEIEKRYADRVYTFVWIDDFAAARNEAFSKATGDYLFWLDADDIIPEQSLKNQGTLREMLEREQPDVVMCPYDIGESGDGGRLTFYRERFLKRSAGFLWRGRVHECIAPRGKIVRSDFRVIHLGSRKERGRRNLDIYERWAKEEELSPRDKFYYGRELYYHGQYAESIAMLKEMLEGEGWYVNKIDACRTMGLCLEAQKKWERALEAYFQSFVYGEPRGFVCCEIGRVFRQNQRYKEAAYWYEAALRCRDHSAEGDFEDAACRTLTPILELVCCYYAMGEREKAYEYHKKAEALAQDHPSVRYNRKFFEGDHSSP